MISRAGIAHHGRGGAGAAKLIGHIMAYPGFGLNCEYEEVVEGWHVLVCDFL
jgi:hypothetical protein